ncbi:MAG: DUF3275 family protein [Saezia sp.]
MIKQNGQLAIQTKNGRFGKFNVGYLITDLGEFVVKNAELDQYPEGKYDGEFCISKIKQGSYAANGRVVFEIRATVDSMTLFGVDKLTKEDKTKLAPQEPDPMDEEQSLAAPAEPVPQPTDKPQFGATTRKQTKTESPPEMENDEELFGHLWPLSDIVKLDATVGRPMFRKQIERLQTLGYEINIDDQQWHRKP